MKGKQNLSFWSVKLSQRANRCILWLRKRRENVLFLWVINVFKTVHLQQLIGMQSSKRGMWKRYHLAVEGIQRGCLFSKEWFYKMVRGWTLGIKEPSSIKKFVDYLPSSRHAAQFRKAFSSLTFAGFYDQRLCYHSLKVSVPFHIKNSRNKTESLIKIIYRVKAGML